ETLNRRIAEGYLRAHDVGNGRKKLVHWEDICSYIENEDAWHVFDPRAIRDSALREWAIEVRHGLTFFSTEDAARELCIARMTLHGYMARGHIRAVRQGRH